MTFSNPLGTSSSNDSYSAGRIHEGDRDNIARVARDFDGYLTKIRPYKNSPGIKNAEDLIATFHDPTVERNWFRNLIRSPDPPKEFSFELWFSEGKLRFVLKTPSKTEQEETHREISGLYPNAKLYDSDRHMPKIPENSFIAGGEFTLKKTKYAPLRSFSGPDPFEKQKTEDSEEIGSYLVDPYKSILSELIGHQNQAIFFQVTFRPAPFDWTDGYGLFDPSAERKSEYLKEGRVVDSLINPRIIDPTDKDIRTAEHISDLEESQAFEVNIRYFVTAPKKKRAVRNAEGIENSIGSRYQNSKVAQQLQARRFSSTEVKDEFLKAANRDVVRNETILTKSELAALAHLPNDTVNQSHIDFINTVIGSEAPGSASQTDKEEVIDVADEDANNNQFEEVKNSEANLGASSTPADLEDDSRSILEVAKEIVSSTDDGYYRDSVDADDYPETSVTEDMSAEVKSQFNDFCASYEQGTLDLDQMEEDFGSAQQVRELVDKFEAHIEEAYLHRAEVAERASNADGEAGDVVGVPDSANAEDLPTTPAQFVSENSSNRSTIDGKRTNQNGEYLPDTQQKHPMKVTDRDFKQTRSKTGNLLNMEYAQYAKLRPEDDADMFMGSDLEKLLIESHRQERDQDIWIGYQESGDNPFREIGIPDHAWFKHMSIFGDTGMGKSTLMKNLANQVARKNYGFCMIDPGGDMAVDLLMELPKWRLQDIIYIHPGDMEHEKVAAINFLEASVSKDHPRYDREVESIVMDLQAILRAGDYWGPKMGGIVKNMTRAMVRSENSYTLYDMYNVLINQEQRWNFARSLERENVDLGTSDSGELSEDIKLYSKRIAEMDEEEVDPVVRRLQDWAENPIAKEIVAHRKSSVNIDRAVKNGRIIIVNNSVEVDEIKRVISTAIMRRIWVSIQARSNNKREQEREPYFAFLDEFHDLVSEDMDIEQMLARARKGRMSICLATQNPAQINEHHPNILRQIFSNTSTMMSFAVEEPDDARLIAKRMGEDFDADDLMNMEEYRMATRITYSGEYGPEKSDAMGIRTIPDYPPVRTKSQSKEVIEDSLAEFGVVPMEKSPGETDMLISGSGLQKHTVVKFLELIWNDQHRHRTDTIHVSEIADRFERVMGEPLEAFPKGLGIPEDMIKVHNVNFDEDDNSDPFSTDDGFSEEHKVAAGRAETKSSSSDSTPQEDKIAFKTESRIYIQKPEAQVSITGDGIEAILKQDSGRSQPTPEHRALIRETFRWFSRLGFYAKVPVQTGENQVCDAEANMPINLNLGVSQLIDGIEEFVERNPLAADICDQSNINIEAEGSTYRKPARTIENVLRAYRNDKKAMIAVRDGRVQGKGLTYNAHMVENILKNPPYYRERRDFPPGVNPEDLDDDEETVRHLYNKTEELKVGNKSDNQEKFALLPKKSETVWIDTGEKLILYDGITPDAEKQGQIEYSETDFASTNAMNVWCRYDQYQEEWVVYPSEDEQFRYDTKENMQKEWQLVYKPLLLDNEVEQMPPENNWEIIILPDPDAINRDPQSKEEQNNPVQPDEESYTLDTEFPRSEVPLLYEDGSTEPLIPRDHETLFTGPREDNNETAAESEDDDGFDATPEELMNSFEQIRLEEETKEVIRGYRKEHSSNDLKRLDEIEDVFGAKHPGEIEMWRTVWDDFNIGYDEGIPEAYLPEAVRGAFGLTDKRSIDAVSIGKEFDLLLEADPVDSIELEYGDDEDDTILRLVSPQERPDLYCEDVEQYADREKWAEIWANYELEEGIAPNINQLTNFCLNLFSVNEEKQAKAAIRVGMKSECILQKEDGFHLSSERPEQYWISIWEENNTRLEAPLAKQNIVISIAGSEDVNTGEAKDILADAVERGELYNPEDADNDQLAINDPSSDKGPELKRKIGIDTDDDDPDDDSNQSDTEQSDGEIGGVDNDSKTASNQIEEPGGDDNGRLIPSADSPEDQMSPEETFGYWQQVREHGILDSKLRKDGLIYYALEHGIATRDDLEERDGEHGEFETLPLDKKRETLAKIGEDHGFEITWENYHNAVTKPDTNSGSGTPRAADKTRDGESDSGGSAESSSGQSGGSGEQSSAGESGGTESATSSASAGASSDETSQSTGVKIGGDTSDDSAGNEGDQPAGDDDDEEIPNTTTNDAGLDTDFLASEVDGFDDPNAGDGEQEGDGDGDDGGNTKFHTYEEPDLSNPSIDVDIDAVAQFIAHHAITEEADDRVLKTRTDTMINVFDKWAEINDIDLDDLDLSVADSVRRGNLKNALKTAFDIEKSRRRMDGGNPMVYHPVALDEDILELIE